MRKAIIIFLILTFVGLSFVSCQIEPNYCPSCGSTDIKSYGTVPGGMYDNKDYIKYQCNACGNKFRVPKN